MKNIDLELYKIFYEVGKYKNITKAANSLYISQPAITQQIKKLESELEYKLFYRTKYGVEFTIEGEKLFNNIKDSMETLKHVPEVLDKTNNVVKTLRISVSQKSTRLVVYSKIKEILKMYPNINIVISKDSKEKLIQGVLDNFIDIGITEDNISNKDNIEYYEKTDDNEMIFVASKKYLEKNPISKITFKNIVSLPLLLSDSSSGSRNNLDNFLLEKQIKITPKVEVASYEVLLELLLNDFGIGIMNRNYINKYLKKGDLIIIPSEIKFRKKDLYIALNKNIIDNTFSQNILKILLK